MRKTPAALTAAAFLALTGCGTSTTSGTAVSAKSATFAAKGAFYVPSAALTGKDALSADDCVGLPGYGYPDIYVGTSVRIRNAESKLVASTTLSNVTLEDDGRCRFSFVAPSIPRGQGPYEWQVTDRGWIPFNEDEAENLAAYLNG